MPRGPEEDSYNTVIKPRVMAAIQAIKKESIKIDPDTNIEVSPLLPNARPKNRWSAILDILKVSFNILDKFLPILKDIVFASYDPPIPAAYKNYYYFIVAMNDYFKNNQVNDFSTLKQFLGRLGTLYVTWNACTPDERNAAWAAQLPNGQLASDANAHTAAFAKALSKFNLKSFFTKHPELTVTKEFTVSETNIRPSGLHSIILLIQELIPDQRIADEPPGLIATLISYLYAPYTDRSDLSGAVILSSLPAEETTQGYPAIIRTSLSEMDSGYMQEVATTVDFTVPAVIETAPVSTFYEFLAKESYSVMIAPLQALSNKYILIDQYLKKPNATALEQAEKYQALTELTTTLLNQGMSFHEQEFQRAKTRHEASDKNTSEETIFFIATDRHNAEQALYDAANTFNGSFYWTNEARKSAADTFSLALENYQGTTRNIAAKVISARIDNLYGNEIRDLSLNDLAVNALSVDLKYFEKRLEIANTIHTKAQDPAYYQPIVDAAKSERDATSNIIMAARKFSTSQMMDADKQGFISALKTYAQIMGPKAYYLQDPDLKFYNDRVNDINAVNQKSRVQVFGNNIPDDCDASNASTTLLDAQQLQFAFTLAKALQTANLKYQMGFHKPGAVHSFYHGGAGQKRGADIDNAAQRFLKVDIKTPDNVKAFLQTVIDHLEGKNYNVFMMRQTRVRPHSFDTYFLDELNLLLTHMPLQQARLSAAITKYHQLATGYPLPGSNLAIDSTASDEAREQSKQQLVAALKELVDAKPLSAIAKKAPGLDLHV